MSQDWTGNSKSVYSTMGASTHSVEEREIDDYYATPPEAVEMLLELETFNNKILEPACGQGHISEVFNKKGYEVKSFDLVDRDYGGQQDFFTYDEQWDGDIVTNPPYKFAKEFVEHSLSLISEGNKVAMFLKLQFLEGKARKKMFLKNPPKAVYVSSSRLLCAKNGEWGKGRGFISSSAVAYCWFVWEKGFKGDPIIKWFN